MDDKPTVWARWKRVARKAAEVQSNVLLFVLYWIAFVPLAMMRKPFADPLDLKRPGGWRERPAPDHSSDAAGRQF